MNIKKYEISDEELLISLLKKHGDEWSCYWHESVVEKYKLALRDSITFVVYEDSSLVGYVRSLDDCGFYIYICDLLIDKDYRGKSLGRELMDYVKDEFPTHDVYVMSDVDEYYNKLKYIREGSIFKVVK